MKIVAGSYEGFAYGWKRDKESNVRLIFGARVHHTCVKAVAIATKGPRAGKLLVTGGADERVRIFDLESRVDVGELLQHSGSVTCLEFVGSTHLLSGSEDKTIAIWRVRDWALLHVLGGHKGAVTGLAAHVSGRMALSVARDRTLRLWNLVEGRAAYIKRLPGAADLVCWSAEGESFAATVESTVFVYESGTCTLKAACRHPVRVNGACFVGSGDLVVTCANDGVLRGFSCASGAALWSHDASKTVKGRLRAMVPLAPLASATEPALGRLATASSAGGVQLWEVTASALSAQSAAAAAVSAAAGEALGSEDGEGGGGGSSGSASFVPLRLTMQEEVSGEPRFTCVAAYCEETAEGAVMRDGDGKLDEPALLTREGAAPKADGKKRSRAKGADDAIANGEAKHGRKTAMEAPNASASSAEARHGSRKGEDQGDNGASKGGAAGVKRPSQGKKKKGKGGKSATP